MQQIYNIREYVQKRLRLVLESPLAIHGIAALVTIESAWIALSARYPQAFDENYHFGLIKLHAKHIWQPFFTNQPVRADVYGALGRDPSYLYHYVMAFPYLVISHLSSSQTIQIIVLRCINIGLFVAGLYVFYRLLRVIHVPHGIITMTLLILCLLPIVPLLAGQINYDTMAFLLAGLLFLSSARFVITYNETGTFSVTLPCQIVLIGLCGSLVKYPFLPLAVASFIVLVWYILYDRRKTSRTLRQTLRWPRKSVGAVLLVGLLIFGGLVIERYGVNLVQYHTPVPKCGVVLSQSQCLAYAPYGRDELFHQTLPKPTPLKLLTYPAVWVHRSIYESSFTITSYFDSSGAVLYKPYPPLVLVNSTLWVLAAVGAVFAVRASRQMWHNEVLRILLLVSSFYVVILFIQNFQMYLYTGEAVAIHGRYLILVYPIIFTAVGYGYYDALRSRPRYATWLAALVTVLLLQGGAVTWIIRSDDSWYWQQVSPAQPANHAAKVLLAPLILKR